MDASFVINGETAHVRVVEVKSPGYRYRRNKNYDRNKLLIL
jgi:hypothetical protein